MTTRGRTAVLLVCGILLAGCTADPPDADRPAPVSTKAPTGTSGDQVPVEDLARYSGIGALTASDCTASLVDTGVAAGPAYVLTAGRCVGGDGRPAQSTTIGASWGGSAEFRGAGGEEAATISVGVAEIAYATMRHVDLAIVRLDATLGELQSAGLMPLAIADRGPREDSDVVAIGVASPQPGDAVATLHRTACALGGRHTVIEASWMWFDVWAADCPPLADGSVGAPLLWGGVRNEPGEIVAVAATTAVGSVPGTGGACARARPCRLGASGAVSVVPTGYAQDVTGVDVCFERSTGRFTFGYRCPLPRSDVWAEQGGGAFPGGATTDAFGRSPEVSLVGESVSVVRTSLVPIGDGSACLDRSTYDGSTAHRLPHAGRPWELVGTIVPVRLPETEGFYVLCAVRAEGYDRAASVLFEVDRTPPVVAPDVSVKRLDDGGVVVRPHLDPPEIAAMRVARGGPDVLDCDDAATLDELFLGPLVIAADDLPAVLCISGMDSAGNRTPVSRIDVAAP